MAMKQRCFTPGSELPLAAVGGALLALCLVPVQVLALQQGQTPAPPTTPAPTTPTTPPRPQPIPIPGRQSQGQFETPPPEMGRDILITGRLVMPDGTPPADVLPVVLDCAMGVRDDTMTRVRGEFRFIFKTESGPRSDLSTATRLMGCRINVRVPGFEVITVDLGRVDMRMGADLGNLILKPVGDTRASIISWNSLNAPEPARNELLKSREDVEKEKWDSAAKRLEKAIRIYPTYATAWYELGRLHEKQGNREKAAEAYAEAVKADPKYISPQVQLTLLAFAAQNWGLAEKMSASILEVAPDGLPGIYFVHGAACFNQKKLDLAEKSVREGIAQDTVNQFPRLASLLGSILMGKGDRAGAAEAFKLYLDKDPQGRDAQKIRAQLESLNR